MKVLIIQQKMIGDVLTSTVLFEVLRKHYPKAELHYLVNSHTIPVIEHNPVIDKIIPFTEAIEQSKAQFKALRETIKNEGYDVVIDVYAKISSAWIAKSSGAKYRISFKKWYTQFAYTHTFSRRTISLTNAGLAIENRLMLLQPFLPDIDFNHKPKIYLTDAEKDLAATQIKNANIDLSKPLYMISVLGSNEFKTYPLPYMADLLDFIVKKTQGQLLFNYIPSQREQVEELYKLCSPETQSHIHLELYGKSLREFMALTHHCTALIGNEGGAVNMAKALDVKTFAIFTPWIKKEAWSVFEDRKKNTSVHLYDFIDYKPVFSNKKPVRKRAAKYYEQFVPELIYPALDEFLTETISIPEAERFSATIITFNEEKNIARCIESLLPVAEDIVVLDSFSTDTTKEICKRYPVRFMQQKFEGHIQQKNAAVDAAKYDRIISLDADEALSKELQASISRLRQHWDKDGYYAKRFNNYCGQWIYHSDWHPDRKLRIFDRRKARWGGINPHDTIQMETGSKTGRLEGSILHWVHQNYSEHAQKVQKFSTIAAKEYFKLGRRSTIFDILVKPSWTFFKSYILRMGFLDGLNGLVICTFSAHTTYLKYLKLREHIKNQRKNAS
ncbi:glycosyltransferase [Flavobacteriaceae bacterium TK19130]|nr:glycosyltransferase [Thermobacterium salinum]